jgi:hypothetical protein
MSFELIQGIHDNAKVGTVAGWFSAWMVMSFELIQGIIHAIMQKLELQLVQCLDHKLLPCPTPVSHAKLAGPMECAFQTTPNRRSGKKDEGRRKKEEGRSEL